MLLKGQAPQGRDRLLKEGTGSTRDRLLKEGTGGLCEQVTAAIWVSDEDWRYFFFQDERNPVDGANP